MQSSINDIRRRLLFLLLRAFVLVLFLSFLFFVLVIGYFLTSASAPIPLPFVTTLEGYYLAKGNWEGIDTTLDSINAFDTMKLVLLDKEQRVIVDQRSTSSLEEGSPYAFKQNDMVFTLAVRDETVGYLIVKPDSLVERFAFARAIMFPIAVISFVLALFLVIVSTLLIRRFVNPLADVIYAARQVASGKLDARIPTIGPQDLRSLSESFNEMAASLERNDRERRAMLADVAHELRTPLSVIRGRLEGIVDGIYTDNGSEVSMALEQTYLLQRLVDDLRLLTLAETRQLAFDKQDVNVVHIINGVIEMFSAEIQEKNISLSFCRQSELLPAHVDPQRFEQVISNLIGNAIRYVPEGGKIWVTVSQTGEMLQIAIADNGKGIPAEDLPYIFDRFWRKDKSRSRATGGTGLGLAIAKQLIEAQGGKIEAENLHDGGLQVLIHIKSMPDL